MTTDEGRQWSRRSFLRASTAAIAGGALFGTGACGTSHGSAGTGGAGGGTLTWWDNYTAVQKLHKKMLADWSKKSGTTVKYTYYQGKKLAEATQLAKRSNQLPDITSLSPTLNIPMPALVADNWFQPLNLPKEALARLPKDALLEGLHTVDGKLYAFPIFSSRWHSASLMINKPTLQKAGLDPANPPQTWDEFRAACRTIRTKIGGQTYGYMDTEAGAAKLGSLAQAAGFEGSWQGLLYRTGEYALDSDPWVNVVEFLVSLQKDGVLYPGSDTTLTAAVARGRWAAGAAGFFFDGPWGPGIVKQSFPKSVGDVTVGQIITPDKGHARMTYAPPAPGALFLSATSKQAKAANDLLSLFTTKDYYKGLAQSMDQPPLDLSAVQEAEGVDPNYQQLIKWFADQVFIEPTPIVRKPEVAKVLAELKPVSPDLRAVVTGVYAGKTTDIRGALKQLSDKLNQALDQAVQAAKQKGASVSRDDFAFPNWQPGKDYKNQK